MKIRALIMVLLLMLSFTACSVVRGEEMAPSQGAEQEEGDRSLEELKKAYPEYFEMSAFKGIEVYVWEMAEGYFRCGMMSGTDRNKTEEEIWDLATRSLSVNEAKKIIKALHLEEEYLIVIPVNQPVSSYMYEIDDDYCRKARELFKDAAVKGVI
ncbi:MAG: hypothetical protein K5643_09310 [Saccharofermentans sp.]|nr:hypothetical protein [Saccharofermentans sp.]